MKIDTGFVLDELAELRLAESGLSRQFVEPSELSHGCGVSFLEGEKRLEAFDGSGEISIDFVTGSSLLVSLDKLGTKLDGPANVAHGLLAFTGGYVSHS